MASYSGIFRIGRDPEMRYMPNGDGVLSLAVVSNYGKKGQDGNRPSQWVDAALFGKRAESLQPYLAKGNQVYLVINDLHIESFQKKDGTIASSLRGVIGDIELVGGRGEPRAEAVSKQKQASSASNDFDDDIPFMSLNSLIKNHLI